MDTELNIFKNLQLDEKHHSNILKRLLSPHGSHNKNEKFLQLFLDSIGIKDIKIEILNKAEVTTEKKAGKKGRVDLYIKFQNHVILIENKITGATNQPNQLYRYWKNLIVPKIQIPLKESEINKMDDIQKQKYFNDIFQSTIIKDQFKLVYLTYDKNTTNLDDSKTKPNNYTYNTTNKHLPPLLPMDVLKLNYEDDIIPWLKNKCLNELTKANDEVLYIFIEQYIDYLKKHFKTNR